jgi:NTP pyrophosphatase (non-canonical NTP hydrolase)
MAPYFEKGGKSLIFDRRFRHVGRIKRASGTADPEGLRQINEAFTAIAEMDPPRLDILRATQDGIYTPREVWQAFRKQRLDTLMPLDLAPINLSFAQLRRANRARLPHFKNRNGNPAHSTPDGSDWCLAQWCNAVTGELGEAANIIKKIERGDFTLEQSRDSLARELADAVTYIDILAFRAGIDLGAATAEKWNEVSLRVGYKASIESFR